MKPKGQEAIRERLKGMTKEQELAYWAEQSKRLAELRDAGNEKCSAQPAFRGEPVTCDLPTQLDLAFRNFASWLRDDCHTLFRENEAVNIFTFSFLLPTASGLSPFSSPSQLGIEVAVPQVTGGDAKKLVRKDLVIWSHDARTCWSDGNVPSNVPLAILEWKRPGWRIPSSRSQSRVHSSQDIDWLKTFTRRYPASIGYSVNVPKTDEANLLSVVRVEQGEHMPRVDYL